MPKNTKFFNSFSGLSPVVSPFGLFGGLTPACLDGGGGSGGAGGSGSGAGGGFSAAYVQDLRDEAASWRKKLRATEEDNEKLKTQLTEANKKVTESKTFLESVCKALQLDASKIKPEKTIETITAKIKEATSSSSITVDKAQEALRKASFMASAVKAGVRKEALEDAYKLADFSGIKVDLESMSVFPVDKDGKQLTQDDKPITGLDSLVETMVKEKAWLLGKAGGTSGIGGSSNPGSDQPGGDDAGAFGASLGKKQAEQLGKQQDSQKHYFGA
jgi:hypothetical protein